MSQSSSQIKTGSYAVATVYSMPWTRKKNSNTDTVKKKPGKQVIYPIFEECSKLTRDNYWISIFQTCARGKFPRGFQYKNGLLIHRRGNKTNRILIPDVPVEAMSISIAFFKEQAGIMSNIDRKRLEEEQKERILQDITTKELTWKDIKGERIKEILIDLYVSELSKKHNYTKDQKDEFLTTVKKGFMLKCFATKHITMKNGKISNIEGLIYNQEENSYYIDPRLVSNKKRRKVIGLGLDEDETKYKNTPILLWEKYLDTLEKKQRKNKKIFRIIEKSRSSSSYSGESSPYRDYGNYKDSSMSPDGSS